MTEQAVERHSFQYPWQQRFPDATVVAHFEGGAVFAADAEGAFWRITDQGTMADLLDPVEDADLLARLVTSERFTDRRSREDAIVQSNERRRRARKESS